MIPPSRLFIEERLGASNRTPRQINRSLVLNQIRARQPISRADLARISGLQRSTISTIVEGLLDEGWVVESSIGESPRGRKPTHLVISTKRVVVADHPGCSFQGIGINLPGRFNRQLEKAVFAPNVGWPIAQIKSQVEQALG